MNTITDVQTTTPEHVMMADLVVIQSPGSPELMEAMNFARHHKKPVIVEIDDFVHSVSPNNPGYAAWNPATLFLHRFVTGFIKANACTVSTPQLAREYFPLNNKIFVLPNYLDKNKWDLSQTKTNDGIIRIGWAGGNAHTDDLKMIAPVIERIAKEYKNKVKFETMGLTHKELKDTFKLAQFADICPNCDYQGEYRGFMGESLDNYPQMLASHGWDIAIAPVVDTAFNNAKSDLKLKEYSAVGFPIVASKVTPYEEAKESGCDVLLAKDHNDWYNSIKTLIENAEKRREMATNNKEWVSKYWIDDNITKYQEIYLDVIKSYNPNI